MATPLSLAQRANVAREAMIFFSVVNAEQSRELIGLPPRQDGQPITPLAVHDLLVYLKLRPEWENVWEHAIEIDQLVGTMARQHLLKPAGSAGDPLFGSCYYQIVGVPAPRGQGDLWLAPVLGPQLIVHALETSLIHLLGTNKHGDVRGGTGLAVSDRHILTAKHVVDDMDLDPTQTLPKLYPEMTPERTASVVDVLRHPDHDLAVVVADPGFQPLDPVNGLVLRAPTWAESVVLLGYPIIPRAGETPKTVQLGEVVNPAIRTYQGEDLFLYSAIARPGNSGGPIIGSDGRLVGLVTDELFESPDDDSKRSPAAPFYAGLPASVVSACLTDIGCSDLLGFDP